jgi:hypothetical protein
MNLLTPKSNQLELWTTAQQRSYNYITVKMDSQPWRQVNPLRPIGYTEGYLKIEDIFLVYPVDPAMQTQIKLMPHTERGIFYIGHFAINCNLTMGKEMHLSGVMDALTKRFLAVTDVSLFPLFPPVRTYRR